MRIAISTMLFILTSTAWGSQCPIQDGKYEQICQDAESMYWPLEDLNSKYYPETIVNIKSNGCKSLSFTFDKFDYNNGGLRTTTTRTVDLTKAKITSETIDLKLKVTEKYGASSGPNAPATPPFSSTESSHLYIKKQGNDFNMTASHKVVNKLLGVLPLPDDGENSKGKCRFIKR